jgi:receptor protein-tyrosine kinase
MEPRRIITALRVGWWLPLAGLIVGGGVALVVSLLQSPLYTSSTQFFVSTADATSTAQVFQGGQFSAERAIAYARLITGEDLAERVIDRLELDMTEGELQSEIEATAETVLVDVTVTDPSAERAQRIADALGTEFTAFVAELETPQAGGAPPIQVTVTDRPEVAGAPSSPETRRNVTNGALFGLLVGAAVAVARGGTDRSIKDEELVAELVGAPVIGHVVRDDFLAKRHVIDRRGAGRAAESYRQLRNNLQRLDVDEQPRVIMVTSAVPGEGKTTAVLNLALALAETGRKVTILDADLRTPKATEYLGMDSGAGLSDILAGTADIADVVKRYGDRDVWVIGAGPTPSDPGELLASSNMQPVIDKLRGDSDYVLVDSPSVLPVADSSGLAVHMDGVLLAVRHGMTGTEQVRQATGLLERARSRILGVVLTFVPAKTDITEGTGHGSDNPLDPL